MQPVEIRHAIDAEQHGLAIDNEVRIPVAARRSDVPREAIGLVMAVAGEQLHALALALNDQAIAVMLISWIHSGRSGLSLPWSECRVRMGIWAWGIFRQHSLSMPCLSGSAPEKCHLRKWLLEVTSLVSERPQR